MGSISEKKPVPSSRRRWCIILSVAALISITVAVVTPLAVILPKRGRKYPGTVIVPLYVYPENETSWEPLYEAIEDHSETDFTVVVNPNSGPGPWPYPPGRYSTEVEKLNSYDNVDTVGYVSTSWATRNITEVVADISTYSGWFANSSSIAMHGIFFDEAPHDYSAEAVDYMKTINQAVKDSTGLQGDKIVIHNPGVIPDSRYDDDSTDITVIFEEAYATWDSKRANVAALPKRRSNYSIMVHSVPELSTRDLRKYVEQLSQYAEYLFLTHNDEQYYQSFHQLFDDFVDVIPKKKK